MKLDMDLHTLLTTKQVKYLVSFLLPATILLMIYNRLGIYPVVSKTVLTSDLNGQYVSFYSYLKSMVMEGKGFFYSFSKTLGGDAIGFASYYLFSPLNFFLLFISAKELPTALMVLGLMKVGLAGFTSYLCFHSDHEETYVDLMFSTSYALCGFVLKYSMNLMWLDGVYLLPLVIWALKRIYQKKSAIPFILTFFITIVSNYYTGYMIGLFVVLYLFYYTGCQGKGALPYLFKTGCSALLSIGMSAVILIPGILSSMGSRSTGDTFSVNLNTNYPLLNGIAKFFTGGNQLNTEFSDLPNVFIGVIGLYFLCAFFLNSKIKWKKKILSALMLVILFLSLYFETLDTIWHGFSKTNLFPHRYAFVVCFFLLLLSQEAFQKLEGYTKEWKMIVVLLLLVSGSIFSNYMFWDLDNLKYAIFDVLLLSGTSYLLYRRKHLEDLLKPLVEILILVLSLGNAYTCGFAYLQYNSYADNSIEGYVEELEPMMDYLAQRETPDTFYRMEKTFYYSLNDSMLLGYHGVNHFSSTQEAEPMEFLNNLGYNKYGPYYLMYGRGNTVGINSFLGVKYVLSREPLDSAYTQIGQTDQITLYENEFVLPLAFASEKDLLQEDLLSTKDNVFERQNKLLTSLTNHKDAVYQKVSYDSRVLDGCKETLYQGHSFFEKDGNGVIHYLLQVPNTKTLYLFLPSSSSQEVGLKVNGESRGSVLGDFEKEVVCLGSFDAGTSLDIEISLKMGSGDFGEPLFYSEDTSALRKITEEIQRQNNHITIEKENLIQMQVEFNEDQVLMTTIPYSKNWKMMVDGKPVEPKKMLGCFLGVEGISTGSHKLTLKYLPSYFKESAGISGISACLFLVICIISMLKRVRRKNKVRYN